MIKNRLNYSDRSKNIIFRGRDTEAKGAKRAFWGVHSFLCQLCPVELSAMIEIPLPALVQYGDH